jgi:glutamate--cysteine ligase
VLAAQRVLALGDARRFVAEQGFVPAEPASQTRLGIEIEWQTISLDEPSRPPPFDLLASTANAVTLDGGSRVTFEPGGQVELSSRPLPGFDAHAAIAADAGALTDALAREGIGLVGIGLLPGDLRPRPVRSPRYDAMEAHFDRRGSAGRTMMRQTAAVQVNVDLGPVQDVGRRWRIVHGLGPVLAAAFANSPFRDTAPSGWSSTRLAIWLAIERGGPVTTGDTSPGSAWASYALRSPLMFIRAGEDQFVPVRERLSFAEWILGGHDLGWPTSDDLDYHLTTLFPPVRPRGWLELRMVDALPTEWATVPASVTAGLLEDPTALAEVATELGPVAGRWRDAARRALRDPTFASTADRCFTAALDGLARLGAPAAVIDPVVEYQERYVTRGRCPADDLLDEFDRTGQLVPAPEPAACATQCSVR